MNMKSYIPIWHRPQYTIKEFYWIKGITAGNEYFAEMVNFHKNNSKDIITETVQVIWKQFKPNQFNHIEQFGNLDNFFKNKF